MGREYKGEGGETRGLSHIVELLRTFPEHMLNDPAKNKQKRSGNKA